MTSREAYVQFQQLANKLASNDNINIDIARFVLLYNKNAKVWLGQKVEELRSTSEINEIQELVIENYKLNPVTIHSKHIDFRLPDNWYEHIGGYSLCTRGSCKGRVINLAQAKNENKRLVLFDENWRADFDFEWMPITIGQNSIQAYFTDFTIDELYIDYYRYPKDIDIAGYVKADQTVSVNVDPDLPDVYVNEIIDLVVADISRIYQNQEKLPADLNRIQLDK